MQNKRDRILNIIFIVLAGVTLVMNVVMYFFLPSSVITQITFGDSEPRRMNTLLYLAASTVLLGAASGMGIYMDKKIKYLIVAVVLFIANTVALILNAV